MFFNDGVIVDDNGYDVLGEQQFLPVSLGGGFGSGSSDPTGINGSNPGDINPNATGGWQDVALQISRMALSAFNTYEAGSTAASIPPRRVPGTVITAPGTSFGGLSSGSISTILFVLAGGAILFALVRAAR